MDQFRETAILAAKEAAKILMNDLLKEKEITYKGPNNPVTQTDIKSQQKIVEILRDKYPNHSFLGEENLGIFTQSEYIWIIDPLDGTRNYIEKNKGFSVSIALAKNNIPILGVVYAPALDMLFVAEKGKGAMLNSKEIRTGTNEDLSKALVTTISCNEKNSPNKKKRFYYYITKNIPNIICFMTGKNKDKIGFNHGSIALELCFVACGKLDGVARTRVNAWDFAAGAVIAKEAGANITNDNNEEITIEDDTIICANPRLHEKIMRLIK